MKINTKWFLATIIIASSAIFSCKNPLTDFNLLVSSEVIRHSTTIKIVDQNGANIAGVQVELESGDTKDVYNLSGVRDFKVNDNLVTFGLDPKRVPTVESPVRFRIKISAPGYTAQIVPVTISSVSQGLQTAVLTKPSEVTEGVEEVKQNIALQTDGSTVAAQTVIVPSAVGKGEINIVIPAGTQFKDASGKTLTGNFMQLSVTSIDADNEDAVVLLPGNGLRTDKVVGTNGQNTAGAFKPAAVVEIKMTINAIAVKEFNKPIQVSIPVDGDYRMAIDNKPIAAGATLQLYSYSSDNLWRREQDTQVSGNTNDGFRSNLTISHLSYFLVGEFGESCSTDREVRFSGNWMINDLVYPITVEYFWGDQLLGEAQFSISNNANSIAIANIPKAGSKIVVKTSSGSFLAEQQLNACGEVSSMILPNPNDASNPISTLQLFVRCPDKTDPITILPTFHMFYRLAGTSEYKFLGTVSNGFLRTSLLKTDGTTYDFKAIWNDRVKVVHNKTIQKDNTATVGIKPGDIIGSKDGATNLEILTDECGKL